MILGEISGAELEAYEAAEKAAKEEGRYFETFGLKDCTADCVWLEPAGPGSLTAPLRWSSNKRKSNKPSVRGKPRTLFRSPHRLAGKGSPSMRFALYDRRAAVLYATAGLWPESRLL